MAGESISGKADDVYRNKGNRIHTVRLLHGGESDEIAPLKADRTTRKKLEQFTSPVLASRIGLIIHRTDEEHVRTLKLSNQPHRRH